MGIGDYQPKTGRLLREGGALINIADIAYDYEQATTPFHDIRTAERRVLIDLKSIYGVNRRDAKIVEGSASLSNTLGRGHYQMDTTANGSDRIYFRSVERGRYVSGCQGQVGIGVRIPQASLDAVTGNQVYRWGYFDADNGFGWGYDASGLFVFIRRNGTDTVVRQADFNADTLDGNGASGATLDVTHGHVWQMNFIWYGHGPIEIGVLENASTFSPGDEYITAHRFRIEGDVSVRNPNLPIAAEIDNDGSAVAGQMFVAGRQFSIIGGFELTRRFTHEEALAVGSIGTTRRVMTSFKRREDYQTVSAKVNGFDLVTDGTAIVEVFVGGILSGGGSPSPDFQIPTDTKPSETGLLSDTVATAISGGDLVFKQLVSSSGVGANAIGAADVSGLDLDILDDDTVSFTVRAAAGTVTASLIASMREEW